MFVNSEFSPVNQNGQKIIYIGFFLLSVIIIYNLSGGNATYKYLLLVMLGVIFYKLNDYKLSIQTPTILKEE